MEHENGTFSEGCCPFNVTFNSTPLLPYKRSPFFNGLGCLATIIIALAAILGNAAVVIASIWDEGLREQTGNQLIVYLACTDILTGIFVMIPSAVAVAMDYWPFGNIACKIHTFFYYMLACSSSVCIALISLDRAIAVAYPLKYHSIITPKVMLGFMGWLLLEGSVIGFINGAREWSRYDYTEGICAIDYTDSTSDSVLMIFTGSCVVCYFIPVGIISVCNFLIIKAANNSGNANNQPMFVRRQNDSHMKKTIKSMIVVVATYYICFTPSAISKLVKVLIRVDMPPWLNYAASISIFIASATNPFIYAILRKDYREAFKTIPKILMGKCRRVM
ncbi:hypothetical protein JTE90_009513 [Oedothorax gibbosus]|uniref:G-protein coupled receptors family 1 profile domain-containing protein n=1 Tax=Oedothorax gibbosus TaxID=931172 RepID=A0AAV6UVZ5_9ARAC|nr:hypothetical protein JTE90_009513 [Oedothorax gibbosus]